MLKFLNKSRDGQTVRCKHTVNRVPKEKERYNLTNILTEAHKTKVELFSAQPFVVKLQLSDSHVIPMCRTHLSFTSLIPQFTALGTLLSAATVFVSATRDCPVAVRQVLNDEHESQLRSPHGGDLKGHEGNSTRVNEVASVTSILSKSVYNLFFTDFIHTSPRLRTDRVITKQHHTHTQTHTQLWFTYCGVFKISWG
jgi:hypothetical protein